MTDLPPPSWVTALAPLTIQVECNGADHQIKWQAGTIHLLDHEVENERAFVALGAEPCFCLSVLDGWTLETGELVLRRGADAAVSQVAGAGSSFPRDLVDRERRVAAVSRLPVEFRTRLLVLIVERLRVQWDQANVWRTWANPVDRLLTELVGGLVDDTIRRQGVETRDRYRLDVRCAAAGRPVVASGYLDPAGGTVKLELSISWIRDVWARGLAIVDGSLVVAARPGNTLELDVLRWRQPYDGSLLGGLESRTVACA